MPDQSLIRPAGVGFFGKLPTAGDFVRRGLDARTLRALDDWCQAGLARAPSPAPDGRTRFWRFACAAGALAPRALAGVLAPSRDVVGRCFPLFVAAERGDDGPGFDRDDVAWYDRVEILVAEASQGLLDAQNLADGLRDLGAPRARDTAGAVASVWWMSDAEDQATVFHGSASPSAFETLIDGWKTPIDPDRPLQPDLRGL